MIILDIEKFCKFLFFSLSTAIVVVFEHICACTRFGNISWDSSAKFSDWSTTETSGKWRPAKMDYFLCTNLSRFILNIRLKWSFQSRGIFDTVCNWLSERKKFNSSISIFQLISPKTMALGPDHCHCIGIGLRTDLDKDSSQKFWDEVLCNTNPTEQMLGFLMGFPLQWRRTKIMTFMWPDFFFKVRYSLSNMSHTTTNIYLCIDYIYKR